MRTATISILTFAALSVSCSSSPSPEEAAAQAKKQKTVIDAQLKAIEKAKAVQETVDQQKKDMDKKIDDQGG